MLPKPLISDTTKKNKEQFIYHKYKFRCHHKTKYYLYLKYITNVAKHIHFRVNKKKQRKTTKNKEFFRCHKKTSQIFDHKIHNKCCPKHSFQSKQKKQRITRKNNEKHTQTTKNDKIQKM